jgi:uncharacterized protein (DUF952 family)
MIYHITSRSSWEAAQAAGEYRAPSLETEGFIHASTREQVAATAARFYRGQAGLVLLAIDPTRLHAALRYDPVSLEGEQTHFPHIYGALNNIAVVAAADFPPEPDGTFRFPPNLA